jgi:uncharacterized delta-60 repeat protein
MKLEALIVVSVLLITPHPPQAACDPNIPTDLSGDCNVDFNDFAIMASDWLTAAVPHEWVARYNGTGGDYYDAAQAIALDRNGNIYVTGLSIGSSTYNDYATIKYSPDTNAPVWVARYNGPANRGDVAGAIAVDSNGNIYVTGHSVGYGTDNDYTTIKYSPDSNQPVWVARYNGAVNGSDRAEAIAVDSNDNIYVAGRSTGSGTDYDYATIKYLPDSNQPVWVARYNGLGNAEDGAEAIAVDSNGNIYVTGHCVGAGTDYDYATIKYSPDSNQPVWVARYNGPGNGSDRAHAIAVDSNDNIYVTGFSYSAATGWDYATIKYSPDSNEPVWVARYNGPGDSSDIVRDIAIDSNDNIYVTGESTGSGTGYDYGTIKYSPDYSCTPQITGDLDHNCTVDIYDLAIFCQSWLDSTTPSI